MDWTPEDETAIRRYLLKQAGEQEEQMIEERMLRDSDYAELVELIEEEIIDDYAKGLPGTVERSVLEQKFFLSSQRREKVMIANAAIHSASKPSGRGTTEARYVATDELTESTQRVQYEPRPTPRWLQLVHSLIVPTPLRIAGVALGVVLLVAVPYFILRQQRQKGAEESAIAAVMNPYTKERPSEGRISSVGYSPYSPLRGPDSSTSDYLSLDRAERILKDSPSDPRTTQALWQLYLGRREYDKAIEVITRAIARNPNNARAHSDMGLALLEKWEIEKGSLMSQQREELLDRSRTQLESALKIDGDMLEARFNLALLYQRSKQTARAIEAWREYLSRDSSSDWAKEAKTNLERLEK